jgi:hypothetical protein
MSVDLDILMGEFKDNIVVKVYNRPPWKSGCLLAGKRPPLINK